MAKIISLFNFKNGVGKTTIALNLSKHLESNVIELEEDYLTMFEIGKLEKDIDINEDKTYIYDINSQDRYKISHILKKSDYILIPTYNDYKDLIKTAASIKYAKKRLKKNAEIIVIFNRLDFTNIIPEKRFTKNSKDFLKKVDDNIKFLYIRNNRVWFNHSFRGRFYLDYSIYQIEKESDTKANISIMSYFTNNELLEIMYQYLFYYGPIYKLLSSKIKKNEKDREKNRSIKKFNGVLTEKEIATARKDFEKINGAPMVTDSKKLYSFLKSLISDYLYKEYANREIDLNRIENATEKKVFEEKEKFQKNEKNSLESAIRNLKLKEEAIHYALSEHINLKKLLTYRKVIKDFRNLLIMIKEYNWEGYIDNYWCGSKKGIWKISR